MSAKSPQILFWILGSFVFPDPGLETKTASTSVYRGSIPLGSTTSAAAMRRRCKGNSMNDILEQKYNSWNETKKSLQKSEHFQHLYFKERDIWWCSLGLSIGGEAHGKGEAFRRPILILKKLSADLCIALPLSTQEKRGTWFTAITFLNQKRSVMLYQIRLLHKKRFQHKMGGLDHRQFMHIKEKLEILLELPVKSSPRQSEDRRDTSQN